MPPNFHTQSIVRSRWWYQDTERDRIKIFFITSATIITHISSNGSQLMFWMAIQKVSYLLGTSWCAKRDLLHSFCDVSCPLLSTIVERSRWSTKHFAPFWKPKQFEKCQTTDFRLYARTVIDPKKEASMSKVVNNNVFYDSTSRSTASAITPLDRLLPTCSWCIVSLVDEYLWSCRPPKPCCSIWLPKSLDIDFSLGTSTRLTQEVAWNSTQCLLSFEFKGSPG
jgi:hypothetical protein